MATTASKKLEKIYVDGRKQRKFTAEFRLENLGQGNYFAATGEDRQVGYAIDSCGQMHDDIIKHFPKMKKYLKWHLVNFKSGPMHYVANSLYWAGFSGWCDGKPNSPPNYEYLKSTCIYGALKSDYKTDITKLNKEELEKWLVARFGKLMNAFARDMRELFA